MFGFDPKRNVKLDMEWEIALRKAYGERVVAWVTSRVVNSAMEIRRRGVVYGGGKARKTTGG